MNPMAAPFSTGASDQRSNLAHVVTDCPHRERLGWLEQYHLNGPSLRYETDLTVADPFRHNGRNLRDGNQGRRELFGSHPRLFARQPASAGPAQLRPAPIWAVRPRI